MSHRSSFAFAGALIILSAASLTLHAERTPVLPPPYETPSAERPSTVIPWPAGQGPSAPPGYQVTVFAELQSPRAMLQLPNGDVLVSQAKKSPADPAAPSPNKITRLRLSGSTLVSTETFLENLNLPFGMALWGTEFFVGEPDRVLKFTFGDDRIIGGPAAIAPLPFPAPQRHWTRHLLLSPDGSKLYVAVGSASNHGEAPDPLNPENAAILEMNRDGSERRLFAWGLRNPVSMAWEPTTGRLWAAVNERDELGDDLVPDFITHVQRDGFYGWPWAYWGPNGDPRRRGERPDLVARALVPDFSVGSHTAALGITFTSGTTIPAPYNSGALVSLHGSWNSSNLVGYKILYVPFVAGMAADPEQDFLTGFIADARAGTVYGRPVATLVLRDGSILISDDGGHKIWKVTPPPPPAPRKPIRR